MGVARSGYDGWQRRHQRPSPRVAENARLVVELLARHARHRPCDGSPRMTADLRAAGCQVNRKWVARLMRSAGVRARGRCQRRYTTKSEHSYHLAPNRVAQQVAVAAPNQV